MRAQKAIQVCAIHGPLRSVTHRAVAVSAVLVLVLFVVSGVVGPATNSPWFPPRSSSMGAGGIEDRGPPSAGGSLEMPSQGSPRPFAIPANSPAAYNGHYWAGSLYTGAAAIATDMRVEIQVPDDVPQADFYYVLLSVWDNAGSYDQVGFTNDYGTWGVAYSTTSPVTSAGGCPTTPTYYYSPDAYSLTAGQSYYFGMSISAGAVQFTASAGGTGIVVWSTSASTGGSDFLVQGSYPCGSFSWDDYTDYEEVYTTAGSVPPYDFFFTNNHVTPSSYGGNVTAWGLTTLGSSPPSGVNVLLNDGGNGGCNGDLHCNVTIANEPYYLYFTNSKDSTGVELTASPETHFWNVTVADLSLDSPICLTSYHVPSGWTANFLTTQGSPEFTAVLSFSFPSTTTTGSYYIGINATDGSGSGSYDRVELGVNVLPALTASVLGSPGSGGIDIGQSVTFSATPGGGSGTYGYDWTALPSGCTVTTSASIRCQPSSAGGSLIAATVTDSLGYTAKATLTYVVDSLPQVSTPSSTSDPLLQGATVSISVTATGGSGGFSYVWSDLPAGCTTANSPSLNCTPSSPGTSQITVRVTDSNGGSSTSTVLSLSVSAAVAGLPEAEGIELIAGILALVFITGALLAFVIVGRRRKKADEENPSIAGRVGQYSAKSRPSPVTDITVPASEVWSEGPPRSGESDPSAGTAAIAVGAPGNQPMYWDTPMVNPPNPVCWHCAFGNGPGSRYCAKCGLPLEPPPASG